VKSNVLATIKLPVLIVQVCFFLAKSIGFLCLKQLRQGERSETCPLKYAEKFAADLTGAEGGAIVYTLRGDEWLKGVT